MSPLERCLFSFSALSFSASLLYSGLQRIEWIMPICTGQGSLLQIQMLISSGNTITDIPRNNALPAIWASLSSFRLIHKINHPTNLKQTHSETRIKMKQSPVHNFSQARAKTRSLCNPQKYQTSLSLAVSDYFCSQSWNCSGFLTASNLEQTPAFLDPLPKHPAEAQVL